MAALYLDADVSVHVAPHIERGCHPTMTAGALGLRTATDDAQLEIAVARGWVLVTHNRKDFRLLHDAWHRFARMWSVQASHPGILVVRQASAAQVAADVLALLNSGVELENALYEWTSSRGWLRRPLPF